MRKNRRIWIRFTEEQYRQVVNDAKNSGHTSLSSYIRSQLSKKDVEEKIAKILRLLEDCY